MYIEMLFRKDHLESTLRITVQRILSSLLIAGQALPAIQSGSYSFFSGASEAQLAYQALIESLSDGRVDLSDRIGFPTRLVSALAHSVSLQAPPGPVTIDLNSTAGHQEVTIPGRRVRAVVVIRVGLLPQRDLEDPTPTSIVTEVRRIDVRMFLDVVIDRTEGPRVRFVPDMINRQVDGGTPWTEPRIELMTADFNDRRSTYWLGVNSFISNARPRSIASRDSTPTLIESLLDVLANLPTINLRGLSNRFQTDTGLSLVNAGVTLIEGARLGSSDAPAQVQFRLQLETASSFLTASNNGTIRTAWPFFYTHGSLYADVLDPTQSALIIIHGEIFAQAIRHTLEHNISAESVPVGTRLEIFGFSHGWRDGVALVNGHFNIVDGCPVIGQDIDTHLNLVVEFEVITTAAGATALRAGITLGIHVGRSDIFICALGLGLAGLFAIVLGAIFLPLAVVILSGEIEALAGSGIRERLACRARVPNLERDPRNSQRLLMTLDLPPIGNLFTDLVLRRQPTVEVTSRGLEYGLSFRLADADYLASLTPELVSGGEFALATTASCDPDFWTWYIQVRNPSLAPLRVQRPELVGPSTSPWQALFSPGSSIATPWEVWEPALRSQITDNDPRGVLIPAHGTATFFLRFRLPRYSELFARVTEEAAAMGSLPSDFELNREAEIRYNSQYARIGRSLEGLEDTTARFLVFTGRGIRLVHSPPFVPPSAFRVDAGVNACVLSGRSSAGPPWSSPRTAMSGRDLVSEAVRAALAPDRGMALPKGALLRTPEDFAFWPPEMGLDSLGEGDAMFLDVDRDSSQPGSSDAPSLGELLLKQGAF